MNASVAPRSPSAGAAPEVAEALAMPTEAVTVARSAGRSVMGATLGSIIMTLVGLGTAGLAVLGVRVVPVLTGSMEPTIAAGALTLTAPIDPARVHVGQVIAFRPPPEFATAGDRPVMHRVVAVEVLGGGVAVTTRGDANPRNDPWKLLLTPHSDLGREIFSVPYLGHLVAGGTSSAAALVGGLLLLGLALKGLRGGRRLPDCSCPAPQASA